MSDQKVKVFYDGLCILCSSEINHYKKMSGSEKIKFIDITSSEFSAQAENLDPYKIHKELHSKDENGQTFIGVETFILIWSKLDKLQWLARVAKTTPIKKTLEFNYKLFVRLRPYLPRRGCEESPYCETKARL